jgi:hypothetical protein
MKKHKCLFLFTLILFFSFIFNTECLAQEKKTFLQDRFYEYSEVVTKNFTKEKLILLKNDFEREGIIFTFSNLKFNKKKEIIRIRIKVTNKKSNSEISFNNNKPIPNVKIGELNGITQITTTLATEIKFINQN